MNSILYFSELTGLLPLNLIKDLDKIIPFKDISKTKGNKITLNSLGKELMAGIEGKLCQLGVLDKKHLNYYLFKGLDFDGTLSLLVNKANDARPMDNAIANILAISELPNIKTGIITGRTIREFNKLISYDKDFEKFHKELGRKIFISGLHGLETLENNQIKANISPEHSAMLEILRTKIKEFKSLYSEKECAITNFEDKGCAIAFHFNHEDPEKKELALIQAHGLIKDSNIPVMQTENKEPILKFIYGSGVLEIIPPASNKGKIYHKFFDDYKNSIQDQLDVNSKAKIILSYSGDDVTDFDVFKSIIDLKKKHNNIICPSPVLVINNRCPDFSQKITDLDFDVTVISIYKYKNFLDSQTEILNLIDNYFMF